MTTTRLDRWERRTEWPLAGSAAVFLAAYAWPILEPSLVHGWRRACEITVYAAWLLFAVDYTARVVLADRRLHFVLHHLPDLAAVALPVLRPLRLLRLIALIRVLNRRATDSLQGRVALYVSSSVVVVIFVAALAELDAERGHIGARIQTFGDAVWWAITTVTTVGYGDRYPVTTDGRLVAVGLMLAGIALIGVVTASIASWLIANVRAAEADTEHALQRQITALHTELLEIKALLKADAADR
ncbi:potassium channel family protein [Jatrophihabitans telluris]|uniref:Potassium channel family protein n=1 Tax=Jatrophihabitans telluris TaxID=2038343 RepID=A0ABY4QVD0_9ACTN|nr:potassium channel family protein [Jatrophihabitans telluris]UQX86940.1 potassium channel family protein [Jatrophihabitans telluris]